MKLLSFLRTTSLWILLLPVVLTITGAASNQAVLIANHDKFPVMLNDYKIVGYELQAEKATQSDDPDVAEQAAFDLESLKHGFLDDTHCIMTNDTHLNFLADVIDFRGEGILSVGDLLIEAGAYLGVCALFVYVYAVTSKLRKLQS